MSLPDRDCAGWTSSRSEGLAVVGMHPMCKTSKVRGDALVVSNGRLGSVLVSANKSPRRVGLTSDTGTRTDARLYPSPARSAFAGEKK